VGAQNNTVSVATWLRAGLNDLEFEFLQGQIFLSSLKRGSGGEWSASRPGCFIPWRKKARYLLNMSLGVPHGRLGRFGEERSVLFLPGIESRF
jgi:hypothetical protein